MAECAEATVPRSWNITKRLIWFEGSITASKPDFPSRLSAPILEREINITVALISVVICQCLMSPVFVSAALPLFRS